MPEDFTRIADLIFRYYNKGGLNTSDSRELNEWINESENNRMLFERFSDEDYVSERLQMIQGIDRDAQWDKLMDKIAADPDAMPMTTVRRIHIGWQRYTVAAAVVVLVAAGAWLYTKYGSSDRIMTPALSSSSVVDIAPGTNKAILTLADGSTIVLDSTGKGVIALQGNAKVEKTASGQLAYNRSAYNELNEKPGNGHTEFNTLTTPPAAQYRVVLPDGSRVWLNNASSLRYPVSFAGNTREVELSGEAYFEIAKDANRPFKVTVKGMAVDVLGTSFNVMAYSDEAAIKTTLLEGGVKVSKDGASKILRPGEQAQLNAAGLKVQDDVNTDAVIAWKNGYFNFDKADIPTVMRQIGRWYDIEVAYEGAVPVRSFGGKLGRDLNLSMVLDFLKAYDLKFRMEGRKIVIMP